MADEPQVRVSDTWLYEDGTPVPHDVKASIREKVGTEIDRIVMHSDVGRALLGIVNSLWDGKGKPPQDVEQIYETGHRLAVRSAILDLDCSAELAELEELVRAAMARRK